MSRTKFAEGMNQMKGTSGVQEVVKVDVLWSHIASFLSSCPHATASSPKLVLWVANMKNIGNW